MRIHARSCCLHVFVSPRLSCACTCGSRVWSIVAMQGSLVCKHHNEAAEHRQRMQLSGPCHNGLDGRNSCGAQAISTLAAKQINLHISA
jgi:hypothetical protein